MEFENRFTVQAPVEEVWALLLDVERIAPCMPGAQVLEQTGDASYKVSVKIKLGPMTMTYKGDVEIVERDAAAHRATMKAKAKEARGQGTATADVVMTLIAGDAGTEASILTTMQMSGKAAAMGQGVIKDVAAALTARFAENLAALVEDGGAKAEPVPAPAPEPVVEPVPVVESEAALDLEPAPVVEPATVAEPAPDPEPAPEPVAVADRAPEPSGPVATSSPSPAPAPPPSIPPSPVPPPVPIPPPSVPPSPVPPPPSPSPTPQPAAAAPPEEASLPVGQIAVSVLKQRLRDPKTLGAIGVVVALLGLRGVRRR